MLRKVPSFIVLFFLSLTLQSQVNANDSAVRAFIPNFAYAFQLPGGDVADRYGFNSTIGGGAMYKSVKNVLISLDFNFIFGNKIHNADTIMRMVETQSGHVIDGNGTFALYALYERGYSLNFRIGKIFRVLSPNPNSGLMVMGGIGFLNHRMKIDNQHKTAPQISGDYAKGYDRLTGGLAFNEFIGYFFMGKSRIANFYAGFEFYQAFTKSLRDRVFDRVVYDESSKSYKVVGEDKNNYLDLFFGFKVAWMIPAYSRAPNKYYYH
ncbi:MAG: hypothetical protein L3J31_04150 [Bacteroidales bacterium]|nr:hypothetical protein [Bacteroidales bacterium]MCF6341977.1 hypothetical protein [Bacteroidales bacterium]